MTKLKDAVNWTFNERQTQWRIDNTAISLKSSLADPLWRVTWDNRVIDNIKGFNDLAKAKIAAERFAYTVGELK